MSFDKAGFQQAVGELMRLHRKRKDLTQADVAKKLEIPRASYANMESGRQRVPVDVLWRCAVILGVPVTMLVPERIVKTPIVYCGSNTTMDNGNWLPLGNWFS
jgi:transcriptional regulator with XRE-family HTH domain